MKDDTVILVAEDLRSTRFALVHLLKKNGISTIFEAENGREALEILRQFPVDMVLLDIVMPEIDGFEVLKTMKSDPRLLQVPVIMISAIDDIDNAARCIELGAEDYLIKPFNPVLLRARISATLEKKRLREIEKEYLRMYDPLTGLPNRAYFISRIDEEIKRCRQKPSLYSIFHIQLDKYEQIADSLGKPAADEYLSSRADMLRAILPDSSVLARTGDKTLGVLLYNLKSTLHGEAMGIKIHEALTRPFHALDHEIIGRIPVGMVYGKSGDLESESLLRDAGLAARRVQAQGGFMTFNDAMHKEALRHLSMEPELRRAFDRKEMRLFYQPIVDLGSGRISGFEALVRWMHPEKGMILPEKFIRMAEETRLILPLGTWVIQEACRQTAEWKESDGNGSGPPISINISAHQINDPDFIDKIETALKVNEIEGDRIHLELTESVLVENMERLGDILTALRDLNVKVSLDDFGKGYCSLNYLHRFRFDTLKIDRSFIKNIHKTPRNREIVSSTIDMAHRLGMGVIAEGIEEEADAAPLREMNCDYGQGILFNPPLPHLEAGQLL